MRSKQANKQTSKQVFLLCDAQGECFEDPLKQFKSAEFPELVIQSVLVSCMTYDERNFRSQLEKYYDVSDKKVAIIHYSMSGDKVPSISPRPRFPISPSKPRVDRLTFAEGYWFEPIEPPEELLENYKLEDLTRFVQAFDLDEESKDIHIKALKIQDRIINVLKEYGYEVKIIFAHHGACSREFSKIISERISR